MFELILRMLGEFFLPKAVEQLADNALNNAKNINDFGLILKTLHKMLKSLNARASDVEEEIKNAEVSGRKKRKREVEEWLGDVKCFENEVDELGSQIESPGLIMRLMNGGQAAKLIDEIDKLVEQSRNFGELVLDVCGTRGESFLANALVGKAFSENLEAILKLLESRQVWSIGVYGMGGVGKTTLAKHIHNRLLQLSQGRVIWVTVSREFTIKSLQDKIARFLGLDLLDEDNEDIRAARLHRVLSQMRNSVLILDDVWENIDLLKLGCHVSMECCRLIITTRSLEVCHQIRCHKVLLVEKLPQEEAWRLFNQTLGNEIKLTSQVEEIAKSVAKLCGGLPLGIITMAGGMRGKTTIHAWKNAFVELRDRVSGKDGMGEDDVFRILKYSFDQLQKNYQSNEFNTLQRCFLYCLLYPEDYQIHREDLVRKFISEGLVDQRKSRRAKINQGHCILDRLVNVCLLESCVGYECVKMHDLVRVMALKIVEGVYMVRAGEKSLMEIPERRRVDKGSGEGVLNEERDKEDWRWNLFRLS
ncbi:probable disease resistance protein At4g27220 [Salvia hispanica]|uniref:probable disease resistance protein At4g27220 n=1 Tax=Salvia hispanica TaxID=49212 RepID=UPI0020093013|nr:probable disease resistance protein At4g27220 [Salvia hispanica]